MDGRTANGRVLGKETKGRAGYYRTWLLMADCESGRNKDHMPQYYVRLTEMQRRTYQAQKNKQTNVFLLHSTLSNISVLIVYFRIYVKRISIL
jgi:hypothetical protein